MTVNYILLLLERFQMLYCFNCTRTICKVYANYAHCGQLLCQRPCCVLYIFTSCIKILYFIKLAFNVSIQAHAQMIFKKSARNVDFLLPKQFIKYFSKLWTLIKTYVSYMLFNCLLRRVIILLTTCPSF